MPELMPWEKPLNVKLPEAATCIGCGRNRQQIRETDHEDDFRLLSEPHGLGLCWRCARDEDEGWIEAYRAARAALWQVKREEETHEDDHVHSG